MFNDDIQEAQAQVQSQKQSVEATIDFDHAPDDIAVSVTSTASTDMKDNKNLNIEFFIELEALAHFLPYKLAHYFYPKKDGSKDTFEYGLITHDIEDHDDEEDYLKESGVGEFINELADDANLDDQSGNQSINSTAASASSSSKFLFDTCVLVSKESHNDRPLYIKLQHGGEQGYYKVTLVKKDYANNTGLMPFILMPIQKDEEFKGEENILVYEINYKPGVAKPVMDKKSISPKDLSNLISSNPCNRVHVLFRGTSNSAGWKRNITEKNAGNDSLYDEAKNIAQALIDALSCQEKTMELSISGHSLGGADAQNFFTALLVRMEAEYLAAQNKNESSLLYNKINSITLNHANTAPVSKSTIQHCSKSAKFFVETIKKTLNVNIIYCDGDIVQSLGGHLFAEDCDNKLFNIKMLKSSLPKNHLDHLADAISINPGLMLLPLIISVPVGAASLAKKGVVALRAHTRYIDPQTQKLEFYSNQDNAAIIKAELSIRSMPVKLAQYLKNMIKDSIFGESGIGDAANMICLSQFIFVDKERQRQMLNTISRLIELESIETIKPYAVTILSSNLGNVTVADILLYNDKNHESLGKILRSAHALNVNGLDEMLTYFKDKDKEKVMSEIIPIIIDQSDATQDNWFDIKILTKTFCNVDNNQKTIGDLLINTEKGKTALIKIAENCNVNLPEFTITYQEKKVLNVTFSVMTFLNASPIALSYDHFNRGNSNVQYIKDNALKKYNSLYVNVAKNSIQDVNELLNNNYVTSLSFYDNETLQTENILILAARLGNFDMFDHLIKTFNAKSVLLKNNPRGLGNAFNYLIKHLDKRKYPNTDTGRLYESIISLIESNNTAENKSIFTAKDSNNLTPIERIAIYSDIDVIVLLEMNNALHLFGVETQEQVIHLLRLSNDKTFIYALCHVANSQLGLEMDPSIYIGDYASATSRPSISRW